MPELNVNLPPLVVLVPWDRVRKEPSSQEFLRGHVVSACSIPGQVLLFQVLFEDGALYERLPIDQLFHCWRPEQTFVCKDLQIWDCPSVHCVYTVYESLEGLRVTVRGLSVAGFYEGTFDWYGDPVSEGVGDLGHKATHLIRLDNGQFGLFPNDHLCFNSPAWTTPFDWLNPPKYKRNDSIFRVEGQGYRIQGTETGRFSCDKPNFSNKPKLDPVALDLLKRSSNVLLSFHRRLGPNGPLPCSLEEEVNKYLEENEDK